MIRLVRADTLPENINYRDDGCEVSISCLTCPLPICKYDDPGWIQRANRESRDQAIIRSRRVERLSVAAIAQRFEVSTRTVHRILKQEREGTVRKPDPEQRPMISVLALQKRSAFRSPAPLPRIWPPAAPVRHAAVQRNPIRRAPMPRTGEVVRVLSRTA